MIQFAEVSPDDQIVAALSQQLGWSHFVEPIPFDDRLKREFYAEMCRVERWSVRTLRHKIGHLLYERTALAKKPADLIEQDLTTLRDEEIAQTYPHLSLSQIYTALARYHANRDELEAELAPADAEDDQLKQQASAADDAVP